MTDNYQLMRMCKNVPFFRGVFMRDRLPKKPWKRENIIVNLDSYNSRGTHWVALRILPNRAYYFNSFGNLSPPPEIVQYCSNRPIYFNKRRYQSFNSNQCGQLCVKFLKNKL